MFKISPIQDKELQKQYAEACGAEFYPDSLAYAMINEEDGSLMGMSQFDILGEAGYIKTLRERIGYSDFEAMFILARATMNFIDLCGSHKAIADENTAVERLLLAAGFKKRDDGKYFADMTDMFTGKCDGHAKDDGKAVVK